MWFATGLEHFIMRKRYSDAECIVELSDFVNLWRATLKNDQIVTVSKELNPLVEAPSNTFLNKVFDLINKIQTVSKKVECCSDHIKLYLHSDLSGVAFNFEMKLDKEPAEALFREIMLPLVIMTARLQSRQNKLIDVIKKKDVEISEYKRENVTIKRSHVLTKEFNKDQWMDADQEDGDLMMTEILKNRDSSLNLIDFAMFDTIAEAVRNRSFIIPIESKDLDGSEFRKGTRRKSKVMDSKFRKTKSKIDIGINPGLKIKKSGVNLKF